jgi:hypothetical protein
MSDIFSFFIALNRDWALAQAFSASTPKKPDAASTRAANACATAFQSA